MNWRNSKTAHGKDFIPCANTGLPGPDQNCSSQDHFYDFPDCDAFPDFCGKGTGWFDWLKAEVTVRWCHRATVFSDLPNLPALPNLPVVLLPVAAFANLCVSRMTEARCPLT